MSNHNNITSYNLEHIKRYVSGNLSREEMYIFEKALLNDPFLEDAVHGFRLTNITKATTDLEAIKAKLLSAKKQTKIVLFYRQYKAVLNAAAMVIFVIGIGAITYLIFNNSSLKNLAVVTIPKKEITVANADTARIVAKVKVPEVTATTNKSVYKNQLSSNKEKEIILADKVIKKEETVSQLEDNIVEKDSSKSALHTSSEPKQITVAELQNLPLVSINQMLQGRVAGLDVMKKQQKKDSGQSFLLSNNGFVNITDNKIAYNNKKLSQPDSINQQLLNEVVVVVYGSAKKKSVMPSQNKLAIDQLDSLIPVGGWQFYQAYINKKINIIGDTAYNNNLVLRDKNGNRLDDIDIEFLVNKQGAAYNVKVITDIDSTNAKTLADIVKDGPKWIATKKKNKVKIALKIP